MRQHLASLHSEGTYAVVDLHRDGAGGAASPISGRRILRCRTAVRTKRTRSPGSSLPVRRLAALDLKIFLTMFDQSGAGGARTHDPGIMRSSGLTLMHNHRVAGNLEEGSVLYPPNPRL